MAAELRPSLAESLRGGIVAHKGDGLFNAASRGGQLVLVVPFENYESSFTDSVSLRRFQAVRGRATTTTRLPYAELSEQSYWRAGQEIVNRSDVLLAVWDGQPGRRPRRYR